MMVRTSLKSWGIFRDLMSSWMNLMKTWRWRVWLKVSRRIGLSGFSFSKKVREFFLDSIQVKAPVGLIPQWAAETRARTAMTVARRAMSDYSKFPTGSCYLF